MPKNPATTLPDDIDKDLDPENLTEPEEEEEP